MNKKIKKVLYSFGAVTAILYGYNYITFRYATRKNILNGYRGHYYKSKFGKMFYHVCGEGKPLLLVHDIDCTSSSYEWNRMIDDLSKNYKVYVVDLIGCGRSDKPKISYTAYYYVNLLKGFMEEIIGEKASVVATGKSASVITMLKNMEEDLIDKVMVISPEPLKESSYSKKKCKKDYFKNFIQLPVYGTFLYNMCVSKNMIEEKFEDEYFCKENGVRRKMIDAYYESAHLGGAASKYLYASVVGDYLYVDISNALRNMDEDYMVVYGNAYENCEDIVSDYGKINDSILFSFIENTKYLPQLEQPEELCEIILSFIQ